LVWHRACPRRLGRRRLSRRPVRPRRRAAQAVRRRRWRVGATV
jgi:hypothetical protein